ncbi:uncharacterized protein CTRU02_208265 [Colletotrichum truncatum]|uniref:Uncharacterized protein n=1 Tax=Colletotrichum truncatum TaxID=5467 RepID=A0ACC3YVS8_COLTU|nr:uncharacterized protein CTRU02_07556 [Colletotrichum truncatum]KAF6791216.1 hypothetical protein CTRU02_07556 [Colletotrichum truncatum]
MVKISIVLSVVAVALSGTAEARSCTKGLRYCGYNLLNIGDYREDIARVLRKSKHWSGSSGKQKILIDNSRFICGDNGAINYIDFCVGGCVDGGSGKNDFC